MKFLLLLLLVMESPLQEIKDLLVFLINIVVNGESTKLTWNLSEFYQCLVGVRFILTTHNKPLLRKVLSGWGILEYSASNCLSNYQFLQVLRETRWIWIWMIVTIFSACGNIAINEDIHNFKLLYEILKRKVQKWKGLFTERFELSLEQACLIWHNHLVTPEFL